MKVYYDIYFGWWMFFQTADWWQFYLSFDDKLPNISRRFWLDLSLAKEEQ